MMHSPVSGVVIAVDIHVVQPAFRPEMFDRVIPLIARNAAAPWGGVDGPQPKSANTS